MKTQFFLAILAVSSIASAGNIVIHKETGKNSVKRIEYKIDFALVTQDSVQFSSKKGFSCSVSLNTLEQMGVDPVGFAVSARTHKDAAVFCVENGNSNLAVDRFMFGI